MAVKFAPAKLVEIFPDAFRLESDPFEITTPGLVWLPIARVMILEEPNARLPFPLMVYWLKLLL